MLKSSHHIEETKRKMREHHWSKRGFHSWAKGLTKETDGRIKKRTEINTQKFSTQCFLMTKIQ